MYPLIGLALFLVLSALVGAVLAFNVRAASDRAADLYRRKKWGWWTPGGANPLVWRTSGLVMFAFGVSVIAGLVVLGVWHPPRMSPSVAVLILGAAAVAFVGAAIILRARQKLNRRHTLPSERPPR